MISNIFVVTLIVGAVIALILILILRYLKQPTIIAYIITGIIMGPFGLNLIKNNDSLTSLGGLGVILLMFFIGMEISLPRLLSNWKVAIFGTNLQIIFSVISVLVIGFLVKMAFRQKYTAWLCDKFKQHCYGA